ncbi:MAG: tRNA pseudouridine(55) synthase TruB [Planctomycetota bacterium]
MVGWLNVDKPPRLTSRDVVNQAQRLIRPLKVVQAGTLDPMATGVLLVCVGQATRLNPFIEQLPKTYQATFQLGRWSETEDADGKVVELSHPPRPTPAQLKEVLSRFHGEMMQRPPAFSALKVKGGQAYSRARRGEHVSLEPRPVNIHELELVHYRYPELILQPTRGWGTYVRSLRHVAEALESAAVMPSLRHTAIDPFRVDQAVDLHDLSAQSIKGQLLPPRLAVEHVPWIEVSVGEAERCEKQPGRGSAGGLSQRAGTDFAIPEKRRKAVDIGADEPRGTGYWYEELPLLRARATAPGGTSRRGSRMRAL